MITCKHRKCDSYLSNIGNSAFYDGGRYQDKNIFFESYFIKTDSKTGYHQYIVECFLVFPNSKSMRLGSIHV